MTIEQAENQFAREVSKCREEHNRQVKKSMNTWIIISSVLIVIGIVLTIIGFSTPPEIDSLGIEEIPSGALFARCFGIYAMCLGPFFLATIIPSFRKMKKKGPKNFLPQITNLYLNYLKCEDMGENDKEFYKQKLENIRNAELVSAIYGASATSTAAIMFSALRK